MSPRLAALQAARTGAMLDCISTLRGLTPWMPVDLAKTARGVLETYDRATDAFDTAVRATLFEAQQPPEAANDSGQMESK